MSRQRVLVVDAEEEYLVLLQEILRHLGHDADGVASAHQALQRIAECNYDLIIADTSLPGASVAYFHQQLGALRPELARRMLFISGRLVSAEIMTFLARACYPLVKKPFSVADIEMGIQQALEGHKNPCPIADH
jgi:CheY-like chemotaxis protein